MSDHHYILRSGEPCSNCVSVRGRCRQHRGKPQRYQPNHAPPPAVSGEGGLEGVVVDHRPPDLSHLPDGLREWQLSGPEDVRSLFEFAVNNWLGGDLRAYEVGQISGLCRNAMEFLREIGGDEERVYEIADASGASGGDDGGTVH